jgi:tetratricopeptide (TPR) repeat protein
MSGIFNLAVADFGEIASNGEIETSKTGQQISEWTVNYLQDTLGNDPNVEIWPNQGGLFNRTQVGLVSPTEAQQVAEELEASLIFYGTIDPNDSPAQLELGFRILPQFGYTFNDIKGSYIPGAPIRIVDMDNPGPSVQTELEKQSSLVAWLAIGLTQVQLGQSEAALQAFEKAAETDPRSAIAQFFIGRENLFLSDRYPDQRAAYQLAAEEAFQKAIELDPDYARAFIGLGSVYINHAADLLDSAYQSDQPVDTQALLWAEQAIQSYQHVLDMNPADEQYGNPVTQVAMMGLGSAYRLAGEIAAYQGDILAAQTAFKKSVESLEAARSFFESAVDSDPSLQRYLVQTYEHLGKAFQLQGYIYELELDYPSASTAYQQALVFFETCVEQSESSVHLIVQDEIFELYCQPFAEDTQTRIETLLGGQG